MKKRWIAWLVLTCIIGGLLSGCGKSGSKSPASDNKNFNATGYPIVNEKVTYNIWYASDDDPSDWPFMQELEEKTNVHINWTLIPSSGWSEKKSLMFSGGDYPDALLSSVTDADVINNQSIFLNLNDYKEYLPDMYAAFEKYPDFEKVLTYPDGGIYTFGNYKQIANTLQQVCINKTWLDNLGLQVPTTTDELYNVLKAFKEKDANGNGDPNDEIPMGFTATGSTSGFSWLFAPFGIIDWTTQRTTYYKHVNVEDGKVVYVPQDERYKEAIEFMNKLYSEGLIDKDIYTQDSNQYEAKMTSGQYGVYASWSKLDAGSETAAQYTDVLALKGPEGDQLWPKNVQAQIKRNLACIFNTAENPEVLCRWFNEFYKEYMTIQNIYGPFNVALKEESDGTYSHMKDEDGNDIDTWGNCFAGIAPAVVYPDWHEKVQKTEYLQCKEDNSAALQEYLPKECYPDVIFNEEDTEEISVLLSDIDAYVEKMQAKWIVEGGIDNDWDSYLAQLDKLNVDKLIEIYQKALDEYNK